MEEEESNPLWSINDSAPALFVDENRKLSLAELFGDATQTPKTRGEAKDKQFFARRRWESNSTDAMTSASN